MRATGRPGRCGSRDRVRSGNASNTHRAAWAQPFTVRYLRQRRVQAVKVVRGRAGVAAQQLPPILTHPAELHVVILLLLTTILFLLLLLLGLPLDALLLLGKHSQCNTEGLHQQPTHPTGPRPHSHSGGSSTCPQGPSPARGPGTPGGRRGGRCRTG